MIPAPVVSDPCGHPHPQDIETRVTFLPQHVPSDLQVVLQVDVVSGHITNPTITKLRNIQEPTRSYS